MNVDHVTVHARLERRLAKVTLVGFGTINAGVDFSNVEAESR